MFHLAGNPRQSELQTSFRVSRTTNIAAAGLFAALSILLTTVSQAFGLNFPILPYLQFDFGEVAIILAFFMFGPAPAVAASIVEIITLMVIGQNFPYGPILKIIAILSSIGGLWLGMAIAKRVTRIKRTKTSLGFGLAVGLLSRLGFMTIANYYLIALVYTVSGMVGLVAAPLRLVGIEISATNALTVILGFTALFNGLQLGLVFAISYSLVRLPQVRRLTRTKLAWFESFAEQLNSRK